MLDTAVPETVDVKVEHGFVTLTGTAAWQCQRDAAEILAGSIAGHVTNEIELVQPSAVVP
jgi:osmotically-inducible protein OsmY